MQVLTCRGYVLYFLRALYFHISTRIFYNLFIFLTRKNICNLIGWEEYNIGRICTLFSIFVFFY